MLSLLECLISGALGLSAAIIISRHTNINPLEAGIISGGITWVLIRIST